MSFKKADLKSCKFDDCAFVACYFRRTQIVNCSFVGAKFIGCELPKVTVHSSDFRYARFEECSIPFDEMEHSLPSEPNLREDLSVGLAVASEQLGLSSEARKYRLAAISAREKHLRAALLAKSEWYKDHYKGARRAGAGIRLLASKVDGELWGHGERWPILLRNLLIAALVIFPTLLWYNRDGLRDATESSPGLADILWLSITTMIPVDGISTIEAIVPFTRGLLTFEAFLGIVIAGLFVTLLVRSALRR